jgi:hypothetical protein
MSHAFPCNFLSWTYFVSHAVGLGRTAVRLRLLGLMLVTIAVIASSADAQTAQFTQGSSGSNTMTLQVPLAAYPCHLQPANTVGDRNIYGHPQRASDQDCQPNPRYRRQCADLGVDLSV